ncbi:hypothetical protein PHMEG_00013581 [Phytophthora megakarya]|uniref:SWIM-type domain-containing protein n=1 Tax=Phytophthora megakarya TaxID=4795 RepID=A0A225W6F1_9STRA|nr:hypothetical protein PHMEG_00013581 [Phytophthora megakarya]
MKSLLGKLGRPEPIQDAEVIFLYLHQVKVDRRALIPRAKWRFEDVQSIRQVFRWTCKSFMHSGWVCSHVVASLHLTKKLLIGLALQKVPMR